MIDSNRAVYFGQTAGLMKRVGRLPFRIARHCAAAPPDGLARAFVGDGCDVGRGQHVIELEQQVVNGRRLSHPRVESCSGDLSRLERFGQRAFVMDATSGNGDEVGVRLHLPKLRGTEHAACLVIQSASDEDEICRLQQPGQV
jgi:hypothetical protein